MMSLAGAGRDSREGVRMGLWGAAQAVAFGLGGFFGAAASDVARLFIDARGQAYGLVFGAEALLFLVAAYLAAGILRAALARKSSNANPSVANNSMFTPDEGVA
jgi:BCD family chlorophyll transporter-like MFS transporter